MENCSRLAYLEVEAGGCAALFCQHDCSLLTGLIAVPYHYLLYYLLHIRSDFFASRPAWYWHIPLFLSFWGILILVSRMVGRMPLIGGGGIPQTRGAINGRITYKHPFIELVSKFTGGILSVSAGLSLGAKGRPYR